MRDRKAVAPTAPSILSARSSALRGGRTNRVARSRYNSFSYLL